MGLLGSLRERLTGGGGTYEYRCLACDAEFKSTRAVVKDVACPECGSSDVSDLV